MKALRYSRLLAFIFVFSALLSGLQQVQAAPGDLDSLNVTIDGGPVLTTVVQPDGKILIGGSFTTVGGVTRNRIARLNVNGSLDSSFNPNANNTVESIVVQGDGKILIGGFFTTLQPNASGTAVVRNHIARLHEDGSVDTGFNPNADREVLSMVEQADGKIVVVGRFSAFQPNGATEVTTRTKVARLLPDGSLDSDYAPDVVLDVYTLAMQRDGKVLVAGDFTNIGGTSRRGNARLNLDGSVDTSFNSGAARTTNSIAVQADGKILVGGDFGITRLNPDGSQDTSFNPRPNGRVYSMAVQADGKIVIAGRFTSIYHPSLGTSGTRNYIGRLLPDGVPDVDFNPNADDYLNCIAIQADGKILAGGTFSTLQPNGAGSATARAGFARLKNNPATQSLSVPTKNQARWTRGGSSPELSRVTFELSTNSGATWTMLGAGERVGSSQCWQITDVVLPNGGRLRARGVTSDGNGSTGGLIESIKKFSRLAERQEIAVFNGASPAAEDERLDGQGEILFPSTAIGRVSAEETFTVKNTGMVNLTGLALTLSGAAQGDFLLGTPAVTMLAPGDTTTFSVAFAPNLLGSRIATLKLASNDKDENPFSIALTGNATPSTNANLSGLLLNGGTMTPSFSPDITTYSTSVPNETLDITITPTKAETNASIAVRVNGGNFTEVASGSASGPLALSAGANTVNVLVTAQNGSTTKTYTVTINRDGALQGSLDSLEIEVGGTVFVTAVQPDGKTILAGNFGSVLGAPRNNIARLNADGTLDAVFDPNPNDTVRSVLIQADGKVLLGGDFTSLQPNGAAAASPRHCLARVNINGTLDHDFDPHPNSPVICMAIQADGKVLLGGGFTTFQPDGAASVVARNRVARVNADGTMDTDFDPAANDYVNCMALQTDGKILLGGAFTTLQPNGANTTTPRHRIARVHADGSLDNSFDPSANDWVGSVVSQADGRILIGGGFTALQPNGAITTTARHRIARLNADGSLDNGFDPCANDNVWSVALQTDGKVLLAGDFTNLQPKGESLATSRNHVARVNPDGTLDIDFDPNADTWILNVALQGDGRVLLGGNFTFLQPNGAATGEFRHKFARLFNEPATQNLSMPDPGRIEWLRGGSSPEVDRVTFEFSPDHGTSYTLLGAGSHINGGWEWIGPPLPGGQIRARGRTPNGLVETVASVGIPAAPEIAVTGNGVDIVNGAAVPNLADHTDFGSVPLYGEGSSLTRIFTLSNTGTADLTLGNVTLSGPNAADFDVSLQPTSPVASGRETVFSITFSPGDLGTRTAVLGFSSNDPDEPDISFSLQGTGMISSNTALSAVDLSPGTLEPAFSPTITTYTVGLTHGYDSISITSTPSDANATIALRVNNGEFTELASSSGELSLVAGTTTIDLRVTAQDGVTIKTYTVAVTRAAPGPGDIDPLDAQIDGNAVHALAVQPDGKTIIAGMFNSVLGVPRNNIARLNADGSLDAGFDPNSNGIVTCVVLQADGKVLLGGYFTTLQPNGAVTATARNYIARVNPDGSLDIDFDPNASYRVSCMALQADGKLLIGGWFTTFQPIGAITATTRNRVARLNADGTLDDDFNPNANSYVSCIAVQEDGKVLLGGRFTTLRPNGATMPTTRNYIARVNADGTLDIDFNPNASYDVLSLALQPDGKVLLGGRFVSLQPNGAVTATTRNRVARVHGDGSLDTVFDPNASNNVNCVTLQADGKVLLGGQFVTLRPNGAVASSSRNQIARVQSEGTLDNSFNPGANSTVIGLALQEDGQVLIGGQFSKLYPDGGGATPIRLRLGRVFNEPATQDLSILDTTRISWIRGGSSPEVSQVTFELSTDGGATFTPLGNATRVGGTANWQLTGLNLPSSGRIRARGRTVSGNSSGMVETVTEISGSSTALENWRQNHFGSSINSGDGADDFDFDQDGLVNLIEYAFGLDPTRPDRDQLPQPELSGGEFTLNFERPAGVDGITYGAEWSGDLATWHAVSDTGTSLQPRFSLPIGTKTTLFFRLSVTSP